MLLASEIEQIGAPCSHLSNSAKHATNAPYINYEYEYTLTIFNFLFIRNRGNQGLKM